MVKDLVVTLCKPDVSVGCKVHSIEDHNYWIERGYVCPYCNLGSKPVPKCVIEGACD